MSKLIATTPIYVSRIEVNPNSKKDEVSVTLRQGYKKSNAVIELFRGESKSFETTVTKIQSVEPQQCLKLFGTIEFNVGGTDKEARMEAPSLKRFNLQVRENTTQGYEGQQPKINPETGETLCIDGQPLYRHVEVVEGTPSHILKQADGSFNHNPVAIVTEEDQDGLGG